VSDNKKALPLEPCKSLPNICKPEPQCYLLLGNGVQLCRECSCCGEKHVSDLRSGLRPVRDSDTFKERIRRRTIIEHKNAELKRYHGMTKAKYLGLFRMRIQAILTTFVVNVKRMIKVAEKMQPAS